MRTLSIWLAGLLFCAGVQLAPKGLARAQQAANGARPAQSSQLERALGVGVHLGWPTGLGLQIEDGTRTFDLLLAWELDEFFFAHSHVRLLESPLPDAWPGRLYLGPGLALSARNGRMNAGFSTAVGVEYAAPPVNLFLQLAPRMEFFPGARARLTLGAGLYFLL